VENYQYIIKRRLYPGQIDAMPPQLPQDYVADTHSTVNPGENCGNCFFNQSGICQYWQAPIRSNYWCDEWRDISAVNPLPDPPSCITGITLPILLTQDFNDIGVYTPWDGLAYQRETLNNFVYTGNGNTITIFNTANFEFKRFLTIAPYYIDWGDGQTGVLSSPSQTVATHTYTTPSSAYTISLKQSNPWGTTYISKTLPIPYMNTPPIVNPFGVFAIQPPNIGDPIGCQYITQDWIYSGDSNPDVWDFFSMHYRDVPFQVTGYSYTSQLTMLAQYGNAPYPTVGQVVPIGLSGYGMVNIIEPSYTAYTLNNIDYIDFSGGVTTYSATSRGLWWGNLGYNCCTDEQLEGCDCTNDVIITGGYPPQSTTINLATYTLQGNGNLGIWIQGYPYVPGDIVEAPSASNNWNCCWVCLDQGHCMEYAPGIDPNIWAACNDCITSGTGNTGDRPGGSIDPDILFRCFASDCSQIPQNEMYVSGTTISLYNQLLAQNNVYQTLVECNAGCGCIGINELELVITNPIVCSAFIVQGAWNLNCDGVIQIIGFDAGQSPSYIVENLNTSEIKTITPISGFYSGVDFDNLCPSNYSSVGGGPAGTYDIRIEDAYGCSTNITIDVRPDPQYFTVLPGPTTE